VIRNDLRLPKKAVGLAVFQGGWFQGLDLFDRHSTPKDFRKSLVWNDEVVFSRVAVETPAPRRWLKSPGSVEYGPAGQ
jgi:hypothetical protein